MKPARFDYVAPTTVDAAVEALLAANGEGKLLAGGQSLLPLLNFRMARPAVLVDLNGIRELSFIEQRGDSVVIGALTRHCQIEHSPLIASELPVMSAAMRHVAHLAIRNRGTIGGSLSHADPAAELPMMAVLLDAKIGIRSLQGRRVADARHFFTGSLTTDLNHDEIVTDVEFPRLLPNTGWAFEEMARRAGDFALAAVGVTMSAREGKADRVRIGMMGVGETPLRALEAEGLLAGKAIDAQALETAASAIEAAVEPNTDLHASADYRRFLVGALGRRAISVAWQRACGALP